MDPAPAAERRVPNHRVAMIRRRLRGGASLVTLAIMPNLTPAQGAAHPRSRQAGIAQIGLLLIALFIGAIECWASPPLNSSGTIKAIQADALNFSAEFSNVFIGRKHITVFSPTPKNNFRFSSLDILNCTQGKNKGLPGPILSRANNEVITSDGAIRVNFPRVVFYRYFYRGSRKNAQMPSWCVPVIAPPRVNGEFFIAARDNSAKLNIIELNIRPLNRNQSFLVKHIGLCRSISTLPSEPQRFLGISGLLNGILLGNMNLINAEAQPKQSRSGGKKQPKERPFFARFFTAICGVLLLLIGFKLIGYGVKCGKYGFVALAFPFHPVGIGLLLYACLPWWPFTP